jgi:hypothetical protein
MRTHRPLRVNCPLQVILTRDYEALGQVRQHAGPRWCWRVVAAPQHGEGAASTARVRMACYRMPGGDANNGRRMHAREQEGEIKSVPTGYWRNFLAASDIAKIADAGVLA